MSTPEKNIPKTDQAKTALAEALKNIAESGGEQGIDPEQAARIEQLSPKDQLAKRLENIATAPATWTERLGPPPVAMEEFGAGLKVGLLKPLEILTGPAAEEVSPHPVAKSLGELGGVLVSFVPFFKGSQMLVRGAGFLRSAPLLERMFEGALAFGAYEAGAGPPDKLYDRFISGALIGAGGELILSPLLRRSEEARAIVEAVEEAKKPARLSLMNRLRVSVRVDPDALNIERQFHPTATRDPDQIISSLKELSKDQQLETAVGKLAQIYSPGGLTIIPNVRNPERVISALKSSLDKAQVGVRRTGLRRFELFVADPETRVRLAKIVAVGGEPQVTFLGEGYVPIDLRDAIKLITMDTPRETGIPVIFKNWLPESAKLGEASPRGEIFITKHAPSWDQFETAIHEHMHQILKTATGTLRPQLSQMFPELTIGQIRDMEKELLDVTKRIIKRVTESRTETEAEAYFSANTSYYSSHWELSARMAEMLFIDPKTAKQVAPLATEMFSKFILEHSPKMEALLSKGALTNINDWLAGTAKTIIKKFEKFGIEVTDESLAQWRKEGGFRGMEVLHNGTPKEWISLNKKSNILTVRNLVTGEVEQVPYASVQRPLLFNVTTATEKSTEFVKRILKARPKWAGLFLRDDVTGGGRLALLDLEHYAVIRGGREGFRNWVKQTFANVPKYSMERAGFAVLEGGPGENWVGLPGTVEGILKNRRFLGHVRERGFRGVLYEDNGAWTAQVADEGTFQISRGTVHQGLYAPVDGDVTTRQFQLTFPNLIRNLLRASNVDEREIKYFYELAKRELQGDIRQLVDLEYRDALEASEKEIARQLGDVAEGVASEDLGTFATRANLKAARTTDGDWVISNPNNNAELARFIDEDEARQYVADAGPDVGGDITEGAQFPTEVMTGSPAGGGEPPRFQEIPVSNNIGPIERGGKMQKLFDFHAIFAPVLTAMENFAKSAERNGFGAAFTKIFEPAQKAILKVHDEMGGVPRELLGGKTFRQQLEIIQTLASKVKRKRFPTIIGWIENMSREEIEAPNGLMVRGMNPVEKGAAQTFEQLGLQGQMPRLIALTRMMERRLRSKGAFLKRWAMLQRQEMDPLLRQQLEQLAALADQPETLDDMMTLLQLSPEEKVGVSIINQYKNKKLDDFSIFAVSRWLDAKHLSEGFADGRAQYAALHRMTPQELAVGRELDKYFEAAFQESGLNAKRQLGGYWPHLRKWTEAGMVQPEWLKKQLPPETFEWFHRRARSGELSFYDTDPVMVAYKHLRNLFMKKHFDPILPDIRAELKSMWENGNRRTFSVMKEYIQEMRGRPHKTFLKLNEAISTSLRVLGHKAPERFAERIINEFTALMYSATIPFRPALIIRNYWQMMQMTPARIGFRDFFGGLEDALTKDGYEYAKRIGAIPSDVVPLMASTELWTPQALRPLSLRFRRVFDRGFEWYKKADDIGRAAAANGIRRRINRHLGSFMRGDTTWEQFRQAAKINTFDSVDIAQFESMFRAGDIEGAIDHLGLTLARETHFRYGHVNHPAGWGSVYGRLFGQFGTWPIQYKDYLLQGLARGSTKDKFEFLATHLAVNGALLASGAAAGLNLWSWVAFPSLNYTGGPMADMAIDLTKALSGSPAERAMARRNLSFQFPSLEDPRSIFIPGSYFLGDLWKLQDIEGAQTFFEAAGFRFFEPGEDTHFEWAGFD